MKGIRVLVLAIIIAAMTAGSLYAEDIKTAGSASVDVMSNYVWRGQKLSNSWVIQPSIGITYGGFGANLWANYDTDRTEIAGGETAHGEISETDFTLNYSFSMDKFNFTTGYIFYSFDGFKDTQEVYLSANYDTLLKPTLTLYYDFDEGQGAFAVASIGHSLEVIKGTTMNLGASASYNINNEVMGL
ncbi:MAG: hypothetical protein AB1442_11390, partial [Nitrospirota bacterium]